MNSHFIIIQAFIRKIFTFLRIIICTFNILLHTFLKCRLINDDTAIIIFSRSILKDMLCIHIKRSDIDNFDS